MHGLKMTAHGHKASLVGTSRIGALRALLTFMLSERLTTHSALIGRANRKLRERRGDELVTQDDLSKFLNAGNIKYFAEMATSVCEIAGEKRDDIPSYMIPVVRHCCCDVGLPNSNEVLTADDVFLQNASRDARTKATIRRSYAGIYDLFRYAAHVDYKPDAASPRGPFDAWVVQAAMEIQKHRENEDFARFRMYYRPGRDAPLGRIFEINGIVVPISNLVYFLGREASAGYPVVMVTILQGGEPINHFMGLMMRYQEKLSCSRVAFRRSSQTTLEGMKDSVRIVKESAVHADLEVFGESLLNEVKYQGKAVLSI